MKIVFNGKEANVQATTIQELTCEMNIPDKAVAIAVNMKIIPKDEWASFQLSEGCKVIMIKASCGG